MDETERTYRQYRDQGDNLFHDCEDNVRDLGIVDTDPAFMAQVIGMYESLRKDRDASEGRTLGKDGRA